MAINGCAISVSDPGAVPGVSTITSSPGFWLKRKNSFQSKGYAFLVWHGDEIGSTVV